VRGFGLRSTAGGFGSRSTAVDIAPYPTRRIWAYIRRVGSAERNRGNVNPSLFNYNPSLFVMSIRLPEVSQFFSSRAWKCGQIHARLRSTENGSAKGITRIGINAVHRARARRIIAIIHRDGSGGVSTHDSNTQKTDRHYSSTD